MASVGHKKEWRNFCEDVERSSGVTLFADDVVEKSLLELGTADECEHTVARRMGEVNSALETCGLRQNSGKLVILRNLRRTVENRKFSRKKQEYQIKASHRFLGIVYLVMLSMGAEIDQRNLGCKSRLERALRNVVEQEGAIQNQTDALSRCCLRSLTHGPHCTSPS